MRCWRIVKNATSLHSLFHVWRICLDTCLAKERVDWALTPSTRLAGPCTRYALLAWNDAQWCVQWLNNGRKHVSQQTPSAQGIWWRRLGYESDEPGHRTHTPADDPAMTRGLARGGGRYRASQYKLFLEQYFKYSLVASAPVRRLAGGGRWRSSLRSGPGSAATAAAGCRRSCPPGWGSRPFPKCPVMSEICILEAITKHNGSRSTITIFWRQYLWLYWQFMTLMLWDDVLNSKLYQFHHSLQR